MEPHFATVWESVADAVPDRPAIVQGARRVSWREYEERSARLAAALTSAGLAPGDHVGMYLYNSPEYCETNFAALKSRFVPVNVNYRYLDDELVYLLDDADAKACVFHSSLGERIERIRDRLPLVRQWIEVDDGGEHVDGALAYEEVLAAHDPAPRIERETTDIYMLYTGGTTGMPKGVMYEVGIFTNSFLTMMPPFLGLEPLAGPSDAATQAARLDREGRGMVAMPACPLMHGVGGWLGVMAPHLLGATSVLAAERSLDGSALLETIAREGVSLLVIVGDAFARPLVRALDEARDRGAQYDLSKLAIVLSSGATLSAEMKQALLGHVEHLMLLDAMGSTEGSAGTAVTMKGMPTRTGGFSMTPGAKVFTEDDREVAPGSGQSGMLGVTGAIPIGYWKDPEKSARTFREIDGVRYSFPGDWATVEADGTITLLGRGSSCVNTGGEKVYPEEVEEAVKRHAAIEDCLVVGIPDERLGQRLVAVASFAPGATTDEDEVIAFVKQGLAHYKAPTQVVFVETVPRTPSAKADYRAARELVDAATRP
ncbi:MAG: acyl-CoA synthetase [Actinobacteria bacterium]|nr:acyl-CoA synthetase [Actinomycetota bacterium]